MASAPHITAAPVICAPLDDEEENPSPPPLFFGEDELLGKDEPLAEAAVEAKVASVATGLILILAWHCSSESPEGQHPAPPPGVSTQYQADGQATSRNVNKRPS
jgi:hypothetical protein